MNDKTTVQVLREAKYALITKGWFQGSYSKEFTEGYTARDGNGNYIIAESSCFCAVGALAYAQGATSFSEGMHGPAHAFLVTAISKRGGGTFVPSYNDAEGRTVEEVLSAFDEAIDLAVQAESRKAA